MSVGGINSFHNTFDSLLFRGVRVSAPETYRPDRDRDASGNGKGAALKTRWLNAVEAALSENVGRIAGIILEPLIQGAGGMLMAPRGFLKELSVLAKRWEVLLILDEVMTGFGRTGKMWACEHENVTSDILCTAKGLAAGYLPLAATLTTDDIYNAFLGDYKDLKTFFHGHTFTGNPLACAVALENIAIFERENLLSELQPKIEHFRDRLQGFYALPHVGDVRVCGLAAGVELMRDRETDTPYRFEEKVGIRVCKEALSRGAMLRPLVNTIVLMPPLSISIAELDSLLDIVYSAIEVVTGK